MDIIHKYFPNLSPLQKEQFKALQHLYQDWNSKINVISRKDMDMFYTHHVLHSLAIARFITFTPGTKIIDVGTGGGFPGIPLSILFPEVKFTLLDSIAKKIKVVNAVSGELGLKNTKAVQSRSEDFKGKFDFIVSRAVTNLPDFVKQSRHLVSTKPQNAIPNGILYLKGGNLEAELSPFKNRIFVNEISEWFDEPFFETKKVIHLPL
ncbi:16S rRNA (guanine(527)-N(7))-methyltransferase RsmG [Marinilabilia rubra]|uniref:Ribosomal RNA small subunit methyltransferase G n=1 Tax=Marinilabilia rubra TaxID=2162893 RepID=A0A2U2B8A8_9BACT|nr:16S rRNA (guanine(527)-N(7))-methyltransferase RsmG [Marinilabilia rubra]PWD99300.1 16S rRNA (guanine(527)-N(7))-methyltransferase RsmG [Marinilabilia rubra]